MIAERKEKKADVVQKVFSEVSRFLLICFSKQMEA